MGITDTSENIETLEKFIEQADKAMYQAKNNGRNRIEIL